MVGGDGGEAMAETLGEAADERSADAGLRERGGSCRTTWLTGEWVINCTNAATRRKLHYWLTLAWLTVGTTLWVVLRDALWFVGFMSLYAIWISHLTGWAAETPVEPEEEAT